MMGRTIRWDLIAEQHDQMIMYATAILTGTASTEAILHRFTRTASHPTYQAMLEVGRAVKTVFVARYLRDRDLQREIHDGLNVAEGWNGGNQVIFYGHFRHVAFLRERGRRERCRRAPRRPMRWASKRRRQLCVGIALRRIELGLGEKDTVAEVGTSQVSASEVSPDEVSHSQVSASEVSPDEVCPSQVGAAEVGASEIGPDEAGSSAVDLPAPGFASHEFARAEQ